MSICFVCFISKLGSSSAQDPCRCWLGGATRCCGSAVGKAAASMLLQLTANGWPQLCCCCWTSCSGYAADRQWLAPTLWWSTPKRIDDLSSGLLKLHKCQIFAAKNLPFVKWLGASEVDDDIEGILWLCNAFHNLEETRSCKTCWSLAWKLELHNECRICWILAANEQIFTSLGICVNTKWRIGVGWPRQTIFLCGRHKRIGHVVSAWWKLGTDDNKSFSQNTIVPMASPYRQTRDRYWLQ